MWIVESTLTPMERWGQHVAAEQADMNWLWWAMWGIGDNE